MSRKQADYLSSLLGNAEETPRERTPPAAVLASVAAAPSPAQAAPPANTHASPIVSPQARPQAGANSGLTLLARESALARVATGEVKQVTQLLLDPSRVRIWNANARHQSSLNEDNCRDLIDSILAEGGQKVPAIVRRVQGDSDYDYEVIAGSRRHWAISWLRANNYPDMAFLAQSYALDDESAFRISDIENRARKDVSDFERARAYLRALGDHYHGKQARMAERLKLSKGWLSKMLTVATLPDTIIAAFASPSDIALSTGYPLAVKIQNAADAGDSATLSALRIKAGLIANEQALRKDNGKPSIGAAEVLKRLTQNDDLNDGPEALIKFDTPGGRTALSILSSNRNGVSIRLHAGSGSTEAELMKMVRAALLELEKQGKGLRL